MTIKDLARLSGYSVGLYDCCGNSDGAVKG